ncbi:MAG: ATP-binding protein [Deltaproteobacteria bacterium]|nr:ATP-binding protein [Deltaproteobacteria bacterium]
MSTPRHRNPFLQDAIETSVAPVQEAEATFAPGADPEVPARRPRILVVDDTNFDRQLIRDHLEPLCYEVFDAKDGQEAIDRFEEIDPDLVLLDVEMPGLGGFEVCRRLRAMPREAFLPILLVTGRIDIQSKIAGFCEGANDYVTKPIHPVELSVRVESMLRIKRLEDNLAAAKSRVEIEKRKLEIVFESMQDGVIITGGRNEVNLNPSARMTLAARLDDPDCDYKTLCRVLTFDPGAGAKSGPDDVPTVREIHIGEDTFGAVTSALPAPRDPSQARDRADGRPTTAQRGAVVVLRNITKEKALEKLRTEFVSYISHELRTPLTSIRSALSLVLSGRLGPVQEKVSKFIGIADRNSRYLAKLIDDLLDLSRREAGKDELKYEQGSVLAPIDASMTCLSSQAEAKRIKFEREIPPDLPPIYSDPSAIEHVMTNLIGNALKFTPDGGAITVSARVTDEPLKRAPELGFEVKRHVVVSVEDTGAGIPADQLESVFDKFHVVSHGGGIKGTGLGLAIVKKIIDSHGGAIWAESGIKRGAALRFALPELSGENFYLFSLRTALERCRRMHEVLSIVVVRFEAGVAARRAEGAAALDLAFKEVLSVIQKNAKKHEERVFDFPARREIQVVLPGAAKADAFRVLRSLDKTLNESACGEGTARDQLRFGVATYPDDGITIPELQACLSDKTGRLRVVDGGNLKVDLDPFSEL